MLKIYANSLLLYKPTLLHTHTLNFKVKFFLKIAQFKSRLFKACIFLQISL